MPTCADEKRLLRKELLAGRRRMPTLLLVQKSGIISKRMMNLPEWKEAEHLLIYVSRPGEVDTHGMIEAAWSEGKRVFVPLVQGEDLIFHEIMSWDDLHEGFRGIEEPSSEGRTDWKDPFVILPGVAFDEQGNRLGYGRGFYDRWLQAHPGLRNAAPAYDFSVFTSIPADRHDQKVNIIVTEKRIIRI